MIEPGKLLGGRKEVVGLGIRGEIQDLMISVSSQPQTGAMIEFLVVYALSVAVMPSPLFP